MQLYLLSFKYLPTISSASAADLSALALLIQPFWEVKSASLWSMARLRALGKSGAVPAQVLRTYERFVLEGLDVIAAAEQIQKMAQLPSAGIDTVDDSGSSSDEESDEERWRTVLSGRAGPLAVVARCLVRDYIRSQAEKAFLRVVQGDSDSPDAESVDVETRHRVMAAGRSLDDTTADLVEFFEQTGCGRPSAAAYRLVSSLVDERLSGTDDEDEEAAQDEEAREIRAVLQATALYRKIFPTVSRTSAAGYEVCRSLVSQTPSISVSLPSPNATFMALPSPPPSPSRKTAALHLALRQCLASPAFERATALEDASNCATDMLTSASTFDDAGWSRRSHF